MGQLNEKIIIKRFNKPIEEISFLALSNLDGGHGGGDGGLVKSLYKVLTENQAEETSLSASIESHLMGIYAELSRLENGKLFKIPHNE